MKYDDYDQPTKDTFQKNRCFVVIGYSYAGTAYACAVFDCFADAEEYIKSQEDGWTYRIEHTFYRQRNLPF